MPELVSNATKTSIHLSVTVGNGDFQALSTPVQFEVYTPDSQLVPGIQPSLFAYEAEANMSTAYTVVERLQSGVNYTVRYSFDVGSFHFLDNVHVQTLPSCKDMLVLSCLYFDGIPVISADFAAV